MKFGLDKCAKVTIEKGKPIKKQNIILNDNSEIQSLDNGSIYKYLGIEENSEIENKLMKEKVSKQYCSRVRQILKSHLSGYNKITAITEFAHPVLNYSFGILTWNESELRSLDTKTRKLLTMHNMHHPKADVHRLYVPRRRGGRGLMNIEQSHKLTMIGLAEYLNSKVEDSMMRIVQKYETEVDNTKTIVNKGKKYLSEQRNINVTNINQNLIATKRAKAVKTKCKINMIHTNEETWTQKAMHGQYGREMRQENVNFDKTCKWLYQGLIKGETESLIIAAQDQAITTNYIKKKIHKQDVDPKCRLCKQYNETNSPYHIGLSSPCTEKIH
uniref:Uncharacterized protein n=1 Tax=Cacopsylla melanoneura TaxID=428564 RepID=A0A8D9ADV7_9HEMI